MNLRPPTNISILFLSRFEWDEVATNVYSTPDRFQSCHRGINNASRGDFFQSMKTEAKRLGNLVETGSRGFGYACETVLTSSHGIVLVGETLLFTVDVEVFFSGGTAGSRRAMDNKGTMARGIFF